MEIPPRGGPHLRQQGGFVGPVGESALHVHPALGRTEFIGGDALQKELGSLVADRMRRAGADRVDVVLAQPHGLLRPGDLNPARHVHHAVIGRKSLHAAAFQQRLHGAEQYSERVGRFGTGDVIGSQRTERRPDGEGVACGKGLVEEFARIEHFVLRRIGQVLEVEQDVHPPPRIALGGVRAFERIDQTVFGKCGRRGGEAYAKQHPQQFSHKPGIVHQM